MHDSRLQQLTQWAKQQFTHAIDILPASNDASFRRYFRVHHADKSWIIMDAPPEKESLTAFIHVAKLLKPLVQVPVILAQDLKLGFLLLSDLGQQSYLNALQSLPAESLYPDAIASLITIQAATKTQQNGLPHYSPALLRQELLLFPEWFIARHHQQVIPEWLDKIFDVLIDNATAQPQVIVHRDFHSRNLMYMANNNPGIIDFQDAVIGPISYDLVSLLRDSYYVLPRQQLTQFCHHYFEQAKQQKLITQAISFATFQRWFDLMGVQRQLKILGIFCRLHYRDGKSHYLHDLKQTLCYLQQVTPAYPELKELTQFLTDHQWIDE
ncbi:MAG TPA: aminoglycoside phosphotransferase [Gammaproteobacteria bacterium]|nr:aminoglycoside phosphotransferase [Gammaproteobacteria bacterium]